LVASLTSSCAITYLQLNSVQLETAKEAYDAQNYELCSDLLSDLDIDDFIKAAKHEYAFMGGMSAHHLGKTVESIEKLSDYLALPGAVPAQKRVVEEILFDYAKKYIRGEIKTFWIFSTPSNGYLILEDLAHLASDLELRAQAIAYVAEHYFSDRRYKLAIPEYVKLRNPLFVGWADRASFRLVECRYFMLIPEKSDEQSIQFAFKSALSYIANFPKGANLDDAIAIATDCVTKIAQLHRTIAEYYVTIENKPGAEYHFKLASGLPKDVATNEVYPILGSQESQGDSSEAELTLSSQQFVGIGARWGEYVE
jgi:hypothetical protein